MNKLAFWLVLMVYSPLFSVGHSYTINGVTLSDLAAQLKDPEASARMDYYIDGYTLDFADYTGTSNTHNCCTTVSITDGELSYEGVIQTMPVWGDKPNPADSIYCGERIGEWDRYSSNLFAHESGHVALGQELYDDEESVVASNLEGYSRNACASTTPVARCDAGEFAEEFIGDQLAEVYVQSYIRQTAYDNDPSNHVLELRTRFDDDCT